MCSHGLRYTHYASAMLFLYFGYKLLRESTEMEGSGPSDELQEVEEELINKKDEEEGAEDGEAVGHHPQVLLRHSCYFA